LQQQHTLYNPKKQPRKPAFLSEQVSYLSEQQPHPSLKTTPLSVKNKFLALQNPHWAMKLSTLAMKHLHPCKTPSVLCVKHIF